MAFNDPEIERHARPHREYLEKKRPEYEKAKAWISIHGGADREKILADLIGMLEMFRPDDPATKAVYLVAQMKQTVADAEFQHNFIAEYERHKTEMDKLAAVDYERTGQPPTSE